MPLLKTSDSLEPLVWISDNPVVDIAMAAYNTQRFVKEAIESIIAQSYENWHIIIVDDCSKDGTVDKIKQVVGKWGIKNKCSLLQTECNSGYGTTLKWAIEYGQGEVVAIVDSDDALGDENALQLNVDHHRKRPDVSMIYSDYYEMSSGSSNKSTTKSRALSSSETFLGKFEKNRYVGNNISISHLKTFKRGFYNMTIGLDHRLLKAVDKDIILKLEEVGSLLYIPQPLYLYRKHGASISTVFRDRPQSYRSRVEKLKNQMYSEARRRRNEGILTRIGETYCYSENGTLLGKNGM